jgi:hypothetical protein
MEAGRTRWTKRSAGPLGSERTVSIRRRERPAFPTDNLKSLLTSTGPLLAGFSLPSITLLVTSDPKNLPALHELALWSFLAATALLLWSTHVAALARQNSRKTIYVGAVVYVLGILALLVALAFLMLSAASEGSPVGMRLLLLLLVFAFAVGGTAIVAFFEYSRKLKRRVRALFSRPKRC